MEFPKYICNKDFDYTNALVLIGSKDNKATYWRHGGCYRANAQYEDGRLMVYIATHLPIEYVECTEEEWRKSNGQYACDTYGPSPWYLDK